MADATCRGEYLGGQNISGEYTAAEAFRLTLVHSVSAGAWLFLSVLLIGPVSGLRTFPTRDDGMLTTDEQLNVSSGLKNRT